jgi:hypothetical protein
LNLRISPELATRLEGAARQIKSCPSEAELARQALAIGLDVIMQRYRGSDAFADNLHTRVR